MIKFKNFILKSFLEKNALKQTSTIEFEDYIKSKTEKDIDWFFTDYVNTRKKIDIAIIGKYVNLKDEYKSLDEALTHGGIANNLKVNLNI